LIRVLSPEAARLAGKNIGATKFVMRPAGPKESVAQQVDMLAKEIIPALQTPFTEAERRKREI